MSRHALVLAVLLAPGAAAGEFKLSGHLFTLPDGFEIEPAAGPPLVDRPIVADFDDQGRLYVADSSGSNDPPAKQLELKPHRIVRLEDLDGDGRFDRSLVFADRLMFPEGVLCHEGAVYCAAPPTIWKLEDTDQDGVADRRSEWFPGKTLTGCANDLHGPYLGPEGWLYWCKGAFAKQEHERPGRSPLSDSAAHIFRMRPDGSEFDSVMSGGMDNPVEIAFTPAGDAIFTTTFFVNPEGGRRDALVHAVYGGVYPKVHGVLDGLARTGDLLPPITHLGPAVPSGLLQYRSRAWGPEFEGCLFSTLFNLHRVERHRLKDEGSTYATADIAFLSSDNPDFHPTDVLEDADGTLLVLDTGGWYKLCCPTSQIAKPQVLGSIYRLRKQGAMAPGDPRGLKLAWRSLEPAAVAGLLGDERFAVRERAIRELARAGEAAVPALVSALESAPANEARLGALWALSRIPGASARRAALGGLVDRDAAVRQAAAHSAGIHRDPGAVPRLAELVVDGAPRVRRAAAAALGQIGLPEAVPALLAGLRRPDDRMLEHALIYALIEIARPAPLLEVARAGVASGPAGGRAWPPSAVRGALIALDQMPRSEGFGPELVVPHLDSAEALLRDAALWICAHRPEWSRELSLRIRSELSRPDLPAERRDLARDQLASLGRDAAAHKLLGDLLLDPSIPDAGRRLVLQAMARARAPRTPAVWAEPLKRCLAGADPAVVREAVAAVRARPPEKGVDFVPALSEIARDPSRADDLRLEALGGIPGKLEGIDAALLDVLLASLDPVREPHLRSLAAGVLSRSKLDAAQLDRLAGALRNASALELGKLLEAFRESSDEGLGKKVAAALAESQGLSSLKPRQLGELLGKFPSSVQEALSPLIAELDVDAAEQKARLEELEKGLGSGDRDRGSRIFSSPKSACSTCHQVGYVGGKAGPDLTKIGAVRTERDLLESILYPSTSFVRSYESVVVSLRDGGIESGILRDESAETLLLVTGATTEVRLPRSQVREIRPSPVSIMPQGLDQQLRPEEIADLVAFLKSLK